MQSLITMPIKLTVLSFFIAILTAKLIQTYPSKHIEIEVGSAHNQNIPLMFRNFQHSDIIKINQLLGQTNSRANICEIRLAYAGILRQMSIVRFSHNTSQIWQKDRIIIDIAQLKKLKVMTDAIFYKDRIFTLYDDSQLIILQLNDKTGYITQQIEINLTTCNLIDSQFTVVGGQLLIISNNHAIHVDINGKYSQVQGFNLNSTFHDAIGINDHLYIAAGNKGFIIYQYTHNNNSLSLVGQSTVQLIDSNLQANFSVHEFYVDQTAQSLLILDHEQGLIELGLQQIKKQSHTVTSKAMILVGGCRNLVVTSYHIYLTCPELIQLSRDTGLVKLVSHNSFSPYEMKQMNQRLYLFGRQQFAVYDVFGKMLEEHVLKIKSEKAMMIGNYLVVLSQHEIVSHLIISQVQTLYCYTSDQERQGQYSGSYQTEGMCSQYFENPINSTDICTIEYPFILKVINSGKSNNMVQLILVGCLAGLMFIVSCICAIKNYLLYRNYNQLQLIEEESGQISMEPKAAPQDKQEEQVKDV